MIHGRSIFSVSSKLHVRGVTYGTFRGPDGLSFPAPERACAPTSKRWSTAGANAVRTYVPPPLWLLDLAEEHGLQVMVGLAWEQHVAFLDEPERARAIAARVGRAGARSARPIRRSSATRWATRSRPRSCAGTASRRSRVPGAAALGGEGGGPRRPLHLRQLPLHRVPRAAVPRLCGLQRLPRGRADLRVLPGAAAEPLRRPAAADHRGRASTAVATASRPRRRRSKLAGAARLRRPAPPASSSSRGPTSGTAAGTT